MGAASLPVNADPSGIRFELPHFGDPGRYSAAKEESQ
jgi:hypothetical protein